MTHEISITGATGFVGKHLIKRLITEGYKDIRIIFREEEQREDGQYGRAVTKTKIDLTNEFSIPIIAETHTLIHLAYAKDNFDANLKIASNIIKAARQGHIQRIIHCSTAVVSGFLKRGPVSETDPPHPLPGYQMNKYLIEQMFLAELPPQIELAILRPSMIVGPGGGGLESIAKRILFKPFLSHIMYWLLKNRRLNFVAVENVIEAILMFIRIPHISSREMYLISDDDDPDNYYGSVEKLVRKCLGKPPIWPDLGLPLCWLRLMFNFLPMHAPPNLSYLINKLSSLGYRRRISLKHCIMNSIRGVQID